MDLPCRELVRDRPEHLPERVQLVLHLSECEDEHHAEEPRKVKDADQNGEEGEHQNPTGNRGIVGCELQDGV